MSYDGTRLLRLGGAAGAAHRRRGPVEALARLVGAETPLGLTVAGRTDAGVHATGQVCHIDLPAAAWDDAGGLAAAAAGRRSCRRTPGSGP